MKPKSQHYDQIVMSFDAINEFRIQEGLRPIQKGVRICMCCQKSFLSEDKERIRLCASCKELNDLNKVYAINTYH